MATDFILGDSRPYTVTLTINGAPFAIDPATSTVKATIVDARMRTALVETPVTLSSTTPGADWSASTLVLKFPRASTADIMTTGKAYLEVQVTLDNATPGVDDDDWTWHFELNLIKGLIP